MNNQSFNGINDNWIAYDGLEKLSLINCFSKYANPLGTVLQGPGSDCRDKYTWAYRESNNNRDAKINFVAESPDGSYVIAVGIRQRTSNAQRYNGYVLKLNAATGQKIWSFDIRNDSGALAGDKSGFETVRFTKDGGFIVGGFIRRTEPGFPDFRSAGAIDNGVPVRVRKRTDFVSKISKNITTLNQNYIPKVTCGQILYV